MRSLLVLVLLAGTAARCTSSSGGGPAGGSSGAAGLGGVSGTGGSAGASGTGGSAGASGAGGSAAVSGSGGTGGSATAGAGGTADGSTDGGPFCAQPLGDCSRDGHAFLLPDANYCTLAQGIAALCTPCGPIDGSVGCLLFAGIVHGATYTYLDILNADVGSRLVYDATGALVAVLSFSAEFPPPWKCQSGPPDFDPTDVMAHPIGEGSSDLRNMCGSG